MHQANSPASAEEWVLWNGSAGILLMASLGRTEPGPGGRKAWLAPPFEMVGPFSLDELESTGRISFEACMVLSRERWRLDQAGLREEAFARRRAAQEGLNAKRTRLDRRQADDRPHREALSLPMEGQLKPAEIKAAFRRLARRAHPDLGGSHEAFLRISEARDALLARF